ncbi:MAG: DNA repair exonuclease [Alphaproteobacteria bacterium]|nr:DNA repair exonuclease [Alphaproteobacteria bacterium]
MFKFLHAADIHLDSPMLGLGRYEDAPEEEMRAALRDALLNMVALAIQENCAFVVIAGDLFDGTKKDINTALFFSRQMSRLDEKGINVYIVFGNHDAATQLKGMTWPANVRILSSAKPESIQVDSLDVMIHGQSFNRRDVKENLAIGYPEPSEGMFNIGILHTALEGHTEHASYAPCKLEELVNKGYQYWALGHVHDFSVRHENPHVVYPGNLQGRSVKELGEKGAVLVTVDADDVEIEKRPLDSVRWDLREIDLSSVSDRAGMINLVENELRAVEAEADGRIVAVRLQFGGTSPLHADIKRNEREIAEELRVMVSGLNLNVWLEKLVFKTQSPISIEEIAKKEDAIGDLVKRLAGAAGDQELLEGLKNDVSQLMEKLPPAAKANGSETLNAIGDEDFSTIIESAGEYLVSQMLEEVQ